MRTRIRKPVSMTIIDTDKLKSDSRRDVGGHLSQARPYCSTGREAVRSKDNSDSTRIPEQFDVMVTNTCNARCAFCVQEATFKSAQTRGEPFIAALRHHFREFYELGGRKVVITGGEPLLALHRVQAVLHELAAFPDLTVKALYTNGERLVCSHPDGGSYASALARAGLGCVNLSVHHDDDAVNDRIFGLPNKASTDAITSHLKTCGLPFRFNLTLQRGGIETYSDLIRYTNWAFAQGAQNIYVRELFHFAFAEPKCDSDRDPLNYCLTHRVSAAKLIELMKADHQFSFVKVRQEKFRDKVEVEFLHANSQRKVFITTLTVGNEFRDETPYLVLMPDGNLYRGWLDATDRIETVKARDKSDTTM